MTDPPHDFLIGTELSAAELAAVIDRALELKADPLSSDVLRGRSIALLFERPSTRSRVSLESGVVELGGHPMVLRADEMQLTRGESVRDTAYVLSRHVAAIAMRSITPARRSPISSPCARPSESSRDSRSHT